MRSRTREAPLSNFGTEMEVSSLPPGLYFWRVSLRGEVVQAMVHD
jgi:hypothetical protein